VSFYEILQRLGKTEIVSLYTDTTGVEHLEVNYGGYLPLGWWQEKFGIKREYYCPFCRAVVKEEASYGFDDRVLRCTRESCDRKFEVREIGAKRGVSNGKKAEG
jgi:hypothetical protein